MGGTDKDTSADDVTDEQLETLVEDEEQTGEAAAAEPVEGAAETKVVEEKAPAAGPTREELRTLVRETLQEAQQAAEVSRREQAPPPPEPEDDAEMPVTRGELASLQQQLAANQQAAQFRAELSAAEAQFAADREPDDKEDLYYAAVRSLQGNPNQTVASAYKAAVDRHEAKIDRAIKGRINKAAERKLARGEPMGPGSGAAAAAPELPKFDPNNDADVTKMADWVLKQMPSTPGVT